VPAPRQPAPEPQPALAASPDVLARQTAAIRANMDQTWRVIREQVPEPPAWRTKTGERPSWLQLAVAGLAVAILPMRRREDADPTLRTTRERAASALPALREERQRVPAE
jgi:hypothetical protein